MIITGIRDEGYRMLEINSGVTVSDAVKADLSNALNRSLQTMNLAGKDYFLAEALTQALSSGTAEYALSSTIQRIVGPVRLQGGGHLRELRSRGQYDGFGIYFHGETSPGAVSGTPEAYFLEAVRSAAMTTAEATGNIVVSGAGTVEVNGTYTLGGTYNGKNFYVLNTSPIYTIQYATGAWSIMVNPPTPQVAPITYYGSGLTSAATPDLATGWTAVSGAGPVPTVSAEMSTPSGQADSVTLTLCLAPTPSENGVIECDVIKEPTAYTAANMSDGAVSVPVAHQYVETILIPLFRYFLSRSRFFTNADKLPMIEADYKAALEAMGLGEPVQNATRKTNPQDEEAA
jgi:hypothetical protein